MKPTRCATAILFLLPILATAADDVVFTARNLERDFRALADWSQPRALTGSYRVVHELSFCQRYAPQYCRRMLYAKALQDQPDAYVQLDAAPGSVVRRGANDWFAVTPEWDARLRARFGHKMGAVYERRFIETPVIDKLMVVAANWWQQVEQPSGGRTNLTFVSCELNGEVVDLRLDGTESCYILLRTSAGLWKPAYLGLVDDGDPATWFRLTSRHAAAKWFTSTTAKQGSAATWRSRSGSSSENNGWPGGHTGGQPNPCSECNGTWRPPIPGNADDPRHDRGTAPR